MKAEWVQEAGGEWWLDVDGMACGAVGGSVEPAHGAWRWVLRGPDGRGIDRGSECPTAEAAMEAATARLCEWAQQQRDLYAALATAAARAALEASERAAEARR